MPTKKAVLRAFKLSCSQVMTSLEKKNQFYSMHTSHTASVRLYNSLEALNQGSYQYESDENRARNNTDYIHKHNILDFTEEVEEDHLDVDDHEIMIPDIVPPKHFGAMSERTERVKQQIITHFRECNLLHKDQDGKEI